MELHCHGGRAVIAAVEAALAAQPGLRHAEPGEFTRRSLANDRIDLMQAEGLADLLEAETEGQRLAALAAVEGRLSAKVQEWLDRAALLSARIEAMLDYAEEDDVVEDAAAMASIRCDIAGLRDDIEAVLAAPSVERLRAGVQVVIAGPPNAGKSTLLNLLAERDAAIVTPIAGTTRDHIETPVQRDGLPFVLVDTAGLTQTLDPVEAIGVERATDAIERADLLLWLGDDPPPRGGSLWVHSRSDLPGRGVSPSGTDLAISMTDPRSIEALWQTIADRTIALLATDGDIPAMHDHQRRTCRAAAAALAEPSHDPLVVADGLATARRAFSRLLGIDATEVMLDALFGRFCLGK